ncbi:MAG TPA: four helix bundle protein [Acidimicrobiia bacterium]|nr:four helix bundle protein [Acidimicrobiia bacterium]
MHNFRRLEVWEDSLVLATQIYELTRDFPAEERFGLTAQLRSAAVSVGSNIAEGAGRGSPAELARFIRIALGSIAEVDSQLELATRLEIVEPRPDIAESLRVLSKGLLRLHDRITDARP